MSALRIVSLVSVLLVSVLFIAAGDPRPVLSQGVGVPITGYAWSDTIGWLDLNCSNSNTCADNNFGLAIATDGTLSGYAWSENIGWISANTADVAGCPSSPCAPKISGTAATGWLSALAADGEGWDGWISLSGSGYGPVISSGDFSGYSWGSDVVGWVDWSYAHTTYTSCTAHYYCSDNNLRHADAYCADTFVQTCSYQCSVNGCITPPAPAFNTGTETTGHLQIKPALVRSGSTVKVYWDVSNVTACTVDGNGDHWTGASSGASGNTSLPVSQRTTYTLSCTGLDGSVINETATVNVSPVYQEL